jgi:fluoride exporter
MVYVSVGLFGVIGALLRYYLGVSVSTVWHHSFPLATLLANLFGCFLLGWISTYLSRLGKLHPYILTGLGTGLIGSFTTFSTFSVETVTLIHSSNWGMAIIYVLLSFWGGLWAALMGTKKMEGRGKG